MPITHRIQVGSPTQQIRFKQDQNDNHHHHVQKIFHFRGGSNEMSLKDSATPLFKIGLQSAITLLNVLSWAIPLSFSDLLEHPAFISLGNIFSGGVFLSLAFVHLLPHSIHGFGDHLSNKESAATFACACCAAGYFLMFLGENVLFDTEEIIGNVNDSGKSRFTPFLVLCALGIHSVMETAALGVQSSKNSARLLAASIGVHQPAESMTILISLLKAGLSKQNTALLLGAYSLIGPLGLASGLLATNFFGGLVEPVFVALTAGSFIYVTATEIIPGEFNAPHSSNSLAQFVVFSLGFSLIAILTAVSEHLESSV